MDNSEELCLDMFQLRSQRVARYKWPDEDAAVMKDGIERYHAHLKNIISSEEERGVIGRGTLSTAELSKALMKKAGQPDHAIDAMYEYILYVEKHPTDRDAGAAAFLERLGLPFINEAKRESLDIILNQMQLIFESFKSELVKRAVNSAFEANEGKKLSDGTPVIDRLIGTAILLGGSSNSKEVVASGLLLHDSLSDTEVHYNALENKYGKEVACLVRDVSKLSKLSKISREEEFENPNLLPDLVLAMVADARAVMIKIAEYIVQMVTLDTLNSEKKQRFMNESTHMHIPLAERLGLNLWKNRLENLCVSASDELEKLYASVSVYDVDGIAFKVKLENALKEEQLPYTRVESRKKSLRSVMKKIQTYRSIAEKETKISKKNITFFDIRDIIGLRIIVENKGECYKAKDVVKKLWDVDPEFDRDYIQKPKDGYRSLHVSVKNKREQYMEVQIRTNEMHMASDDGHCFYKEGNSQVSEYIKELVKFARFVNRKETKFTSVEGNSSTHQAACSYAKLNKPPCLDATGVCRFPSEGSVYVIVKAHTKVTIEQHPTGTLLSTLCNKRRWVGRVLVNEEDADLDYVLIVGDIIKFV